MKQLVAGDVLTETHLFVTKATVKKARNGKPYVEFNCRNTDGMEVTQCKIWGTTIKPSDNTVIKTMGRVDEYQGHLHYVLDSWDEVPCLDGSDFEKQSPLEELSAKTVGEAWNKWITVIENESLRKWTHDFINFWDRHHFPSCKPCPPRFNIHPAAQTIHHAYRHGLIQHTMEVMRIASSMAEILGLTQNEKDLCAVGAAIHDIGKLVELTVVSGVPQYSVPAKFYGWNANAHLYIGSQMLLWTQLESVNSDWEDLPQCLQAGGFFTLMNVILSHHGQFGDVKPNCAVSQIVHLADMASTRVNTIQCGLKLNSDGEMSMPDFKDGRQNFLIPLKETDNA